MLTFLVIRIVVVSARAGNSRDKAIGFARATHETRPDLVEADWGRN
jgi:hypothetical protein